MKNLMKKKKTHHNFFKSKELLLLIILLVCGKVFAQTNGLMLPNLEYFVGESKKGIIQLHWSWDNTMQIDSLFIERAGSNGVFSSIGEENEKFIFSDINPPEKINYYRLLAKDDRNRRFYSPTIAIEFQELKEIHIAPNPATSYIEIGFFAEGDSDVQIQIMNQQGNLVFEEHIAAPQKGARYLQLDVKDYAAGLYLLYIVEGAMATVRKIVKL